MRRVVALADKHPWVVIWGLVVFVILVLAGSFTIYINHESDQARDDRERLAAQTAQTAVALAEQAKATCTAAVTAVSNDFKDEMTQLLTIVTDRFTETGRPVPPIYLALEAEVRNRPPPVAACIPKENP